mmetsp:Transcript_2479/g.3309  ORF Transcript_2479/g.3309 Transcript_2479/m.3309 type:complete len:170 (+) Transcript_2479:18-527(+)
MLLIQNMKFCPTCRSLLPLFDENRKGASCPHCVLPQQDAAQDMSLEMGELEWKWLSIEERVAEYEAVLQHREEKTRSQFLRATAEHHDNKANDVASNARQFSRYAEARRLKWVSAEESETSLPTQEAFCDNCASQRICWYRAVQMRSADEGFSLLLQCTSCLQNWRIDT